MRLREFFSEDAINLHLQSTAKDDVLKELVGLLQLDDKAEQTLVKMLKRRETLGISTRSMASPCITSS